MQNLMIKAVAWKQSRTPREEGQTVVEYALVIGLVSLVIIGVLATAGGAWTIVISGTTVSETGTAPLKAAVITDPVPGDVTHPTRFLRLKVTR